MPRREVYKSKRLKRVIHPGINVDIQEYILMRKVAEVYKVSISELLRKAFFEFVSNHGLEIETLKAREDQ